MQLTGLMITTASVSRDARSCHSRRAHSSAKEGLGSPDADLPEAPAPRDPCSRIHSGSRRPAMWRQGASGADSLPVVKGSLSRN